MHNIVYIIIQIMSCFSSTIIVHALLMIDYSYQKNQEENLTVLGHVSLSNLFVTNQFITFFGG